MVFQRVNTMVVDVGIARKVWDGKIPCVFTLAPQDKASMRTPDPVYVRAPMASPQPPVDPSSLNVCGRGGAAGGRARHVFR